MLSCVGVQVLHEDEGHAGVRGQVLQQLPEGLEPAGRGADADDGEGTSAKSRPAGSRLAALFGGPGRRPFLPG